jgi:hypothetical protein
VVTNTNTSADGAQTATVASVPAAFTVKALVHAVAPVISSQPQGATVSAGGSVTLTVAASSPDGGALSYQWYRNTANSNSGGTSIGGATGSSYSPPTATSGTVYYYVEVTNTNSGVTITGSTTATTPSAPAAVTVNVLVNAQTPVISNHPQGATVSAGGGVTLTVTASVSDGGTLSYQWYRNMTNSSGGGTSIGGATNSSYSPPTATAGTTYYYVEVTNTNTGVSGATTATNRSNAARVTVSDPTPPSYAVTVAPTTNGTVSTSTTSARAGATVTLILAPAAGYEPDAVTAFRTGASVTTVALSGTGNTRTFTMPAYAVTVRATFRKTQATLDSEDVETASSAIEGGVFRMAQVTATDAESLRTWLVGTLGVLLGQSHGLQLRSAEMPTEATVSVTAFTPATAGTEAVPAGVNGSFAFTVTLTKGASRATATFVTGVIVATPHVSVPVKRVELLHAPGSLTVRIVNTGNTATGALTLALTGAGADAFTLPSATIDGLAAGDETDVVLTSRTGLSTGTYTATLTVSGEGLPSVSAKISHTVTPTGLETPPSASQLKAWMQGATLHITGLTAGRTWNVYALTGALVHRSVSTGSEADLTLPARGVYIIQSGNKAIKVVY